MNLLLLSSLFILCVLTMLLCYRSGTTHREACRRKETESQLRTLHQKYFRAQKELIKAKKENQQLRDIDQDRCLGLANTAHELRNPINALDSVFNLLEIELKANKVPSRAVCQSLFNLAAEALSTMRVQSQKITDARSNQLSKDRSSRSPIELNALLRQAISLNDILASQKAIEVRLIDHSRPRIWADHSNCREIIDHLIRTTIEHALIGSVITLRVENPKMNEAAFSITNEDQALPAFINEFFQNRTKTDIVNTAESVNSDLIEKLAQICEELEAQGSSLEILDGRKLVLRFPHVRLLTRSPFPELKEVEIEEVFKEQSVQA